MNKQGALQPFLFLSRSLVKSWCFVVQDDINSPAIELSHTRESENNEGRGTELSMTVVEWTQQTWLLSVFPHFGKLGIVWNCSTHPTVDIKIKGQWGCFLIFDDSNSFVFFYSCVQTIFLPLCFSCISLDACIQCASIPLRNFFRPNHDYFTSCTCIHCQCRVTACDSSWNWCYFYTFARIS